MRGCLGISFFCAAMTVISVGCSHSLDLHFLVPASVIDDVSGVAQCCYRRLLVDKSNNVFVAGVRVLDTDVRHQVRPLLS